VPGSRPDGVAGSWQVEAEGPPGCLRVVAFDPGESDEGFDVRLAVNVEDARRAFSEKPCDVLVTDLGLPDGSGIELLRELKPRRQGLVAIVLSGYGMEEDIQRSQQAGFSAHFVKPLNLSRLIEAIDRAAAKTASASPAPAGS